MLNKKELEKYQKKVDDGDQLSELEIKRLLTAFKSAVKAKAEDMQYHSIRQKPFEDFFNIKEYGILLSCVDYLKEDITDIYIPILEAHNCKILFKEDGSRYIQR